MFFLKFLSAIASLFAVYPLIKLIKKDEINIFDLIILFHTIFFCLIPIISDYSAYQWLKDFDFEDNIILSIFIFYVLSIALLLRVDTFWTKHYKYKYTILNITYYIRKLPQIEVSWMFLGILIINLIISWIWYLPQASIIDTFKEFSSSQGYSKTPLFLFYGAIFSFCFSFTQLLYLKEELSKKKKYVLLVTIIGFGLLLLFMPRRVMLLYFVLSLIIIYSVKRNFFTLKKITWIALVLIVIIKIYFPFYNVMRRVDVRFDSNNFTTSILQIIDETKTEFNSNKEYATETSEGRALNLYYALYRIIKYDKSPSDGKLFVAAVDHALPKLINPNKGLGTAVILENKMQCKNKDQADSILLLSYGDFGLYVGAFYSLLLFILVIFAHVFIQECSIACFNIKTTLDILLILNLIKFAWNVEGTLDGVFASFIHLIIMSILLFVLSRLDIIKYNMVSLK